MPVSQEEGLRILIDTVKHNRTHRDYKHVVELAKKYHKLITGEGIDTLMRQFTRREDATLFKQRCDITQHIAPSVSSAIMAPFYKVGRVNVIKRSIDFKNTQGQDGKIFEAKRLDVETAISLYYGDKSLDKYLETRFVELQFGDPNSFIVTEFDEERDEQGTLTKKVEPYPWEVSSENAINFKYKNNHLLWLIVKDDCGIEQKYTDGEGEKKTTRIVEEAAINYTIYLDEEAIKLTQVPFESVPGIPDNGTIVTSEYLGADGKIYKTSYIRFDQKRVFRVDLFEHKAGRVPAVRIGYRRDLITKGRTFVSPLEPGVPYFMKTIKAVSEMDLTSSLCVFPHKIQYVPRCTGESKEMWCDAGKLPDGAMCGVCKGSGMMPAQTSVQEGLFMRQPKDPKDMIDLEKLMIFKSPPIDLVKFQDEYIDKLKLEAQKAVFNSDVFSRAEIAATATEKYIEMDNVYDTLFPFAEKFADIWKYITITVGALRDHKDIIVDYRFPKDFKFKSVNDLLNELKLANDSSAPGYVREEIAKDIAAQQFVDKPEELKKIEVKARFIPFADKSTTEIIYIISNGETTQYNKTLWSNASQIFNELEMEQDKSGPYFYDLAPDKQKAMIDAKVNAMITAISGQEPAGAEVIPTEDQGGGN